MSTASTTYPNNNRDSGVVEEICGYLTEDPPRSYFLFAGAGSGKTRTLVEVLRRMTGVVEHEKGGLLAQSLHMYGRSIRVITYTKNAVAVINSRLGENGLVGISTIHAFCWELISGFNDDIRAALIALKEMQYEKERSEALTKPKGITPTKQRDLDEIMTEIEDIRSIPFFIYSPDRELHGSGALAHKNVLDVTAWLLKNRPTLQTILRDRYPIVLIDESQDTMKGMLDALMGLAELRDSGLTLGLLGDHRQRIYTDGHADLPSLVPTNWATPELQMNHRSQQRIVTLINHIWRAKLEGRTQPANGIEQHWRTEKTGGLVRLFVGNTSLAVKNKVLGERWCADQMRAVSGSIAWNEGGHQVLALEHKLVATRGSFLEVFSAMMLLDPNSAAPSGSGENKGPAVAKFVIHELIDLEKCVGEDGAIDEFKLTEVLRRHGRLELMPENAEARADRVAEILQAAKEFGQAYTNTSSTIGEVIAPLLAAKILEVDHRLSNAHSDKSAPPDAPAKKQDESTQDRMRRGWYALFTSPWPQLQKYRTYLAGNSLLATHQVVKGSEYPDVMVVMDDKEAGAHNFSYDKIFGGVALSKDDMKNVEKGKETTIDRTLRLLYVTCSRARETLALVLWSSDTTAALARIRDSDWFSPEEIQEIPDPSFGAQSSS